MSNPRFPAGWDEQRVKCLIAGLDARTAAEWLVADEAAEDHVLTTVAIAPRPESRHLLATHKG